MSDRPCCWEPGPLASFTISEEDRRWIPPNTLLMLNPAYVLNAPLCMLPPDHDGPHDWETA